MRSPLHWSRLPPACSHEYRSNDTSFVPQPGDLVYYKWDNYPSDHTSHVGFVYSVNTSNSTFTAIEGDKSNAVGFRTGVSYTTTNSQLVGFARPAY
ncbi:MAG: CHAP domain-containing protein [Oscillospiraceae bacterium]|nr:CHAP domain-containing protein [Oscillospiraceae bacterium]